MPHSPEQVRLTDDEWNDLLAVLPANPEIADGWELDLVNRTARRIVAERVAQALEDAARALRWGGVWAPNDGYLDTYEPSHATWLEDRATSIRGGKTGEGEAE